MTDLPILFSAPMVRAIIAGRKRQTRRIVADVPAMPEADCHRAYGRVASTPYLDAYCSEKKTPQNPRGMSRDWCWWQIDNRQCLPMFKVKAKPGDRLWVREALDRCRGGRTDLPVWSAGYVADEADLDLTPPGLLAWVEGYKRRLVPSIHMPRAASRITLVMTDVRVERLQNISEADAIAEGWPEQDDRATAGTAGIRDAYPIGWYAALWERINGAGAWDRNPWVAAYTFDPIACNIDKMGASHG